MLKMSKKYEETSISREELFSLLNMFMNGLPPRWSKYQNFVTIYITIILSIIGSTLVGINNIKREIILILLISPFLIIFISVFAKQTIKKQSKDIKEYIAMIGKISFELGLYEDIKIHKPSDGKRLWPEDKSFILPRWVEGRMNSGKSSDDFISKFGISSLKHSFYIFNIFIVVGIYLLIYILYLAFFSC